MSKILNKLILLLVLFNLSISADDQNPPEIHPELTCGEEDSPKEPEDCTDYGTGSGMVCCWISASRNSKGICRLVPDTTAREHGISGIKTYTGQNDKNYWDCGNDASFLFLKFSHIVLFLILL